MIISLAWVLELPTFWKCLLLWLMYLEVWVIYWLKSVLGGFALSLGNAHMKFRRQESDAEYCLWEFERSEDVWRLVDTLWRLANILWRLIDTVWVCRQVDTLWRLVDDDWRLTDTVWRMVDIVWKLFNVWRLVDTVWIFVDACGYWSVQCGGDWFILCGG